MESLLLPADPDVPMGAKPAVALVGAQLITSSVLAFLVSLFSDARGGWVAIVAAMAVSQGLGTWWEQRRPGSVTRPRRLRLALVTAGVQLVLAVPLLVFGITEEEGAGLILVVLAVALVVHTFATWWGLGHGVTLAGRARAPKP